MWIESRSRLSPVPTLSLRFKDGSTQTLGPTVTNPGPPGPGLWSSGRLSVPKLRLPISLPPSLTSETVHCHRCRGLQGTRSGSGHTSRFYQVFSPVLPPNLDFFHLFTPPPHSFPRFLSEQRPHTPYGTCLSPLEVGERFRIKEGLKVQSHPLMAGGRSQDLRGVYGGTGVEYSKVQDG